MQRDMQSQQAWIISQQALSPLVQVTQTPFFVHSHLHMAIARLHWARHMPFIMQQQLHMPSHIILHRFCKVAQATSSSQTHLIFIPFAHFSKLIVQRGSTIEPATFDAGAMPGGHIAAMFPPIIVRSIIMTLAIKILLNF